MEINIAVLQIICLLRRSYTTMSHIPKKCSSILLQVHSRNHFSNSFIHNNHKLLRLWEIVGRWLMWDSSSTEEYPFSSGPQMDES